MTKIGIHKLPPKNIKRWVKSKKIAVLDCMEAGYITAEEACERYGLSREELESWSVLKNKYGDEALKTTRLKKYRAQEISAQSFCMILPEG